MLSPKFSSTSKQIWPNQSTSISPEIIRKHFFADFKGNRTNQFAQIRLAKEAKFGNETLRKSRNIYTKSTLATYNLYSLYRQSLCFHFLISVLKIDVIWLLELSPRFLVLNLINSPNHEIDRIDMLLLEECRVVQTTRMMFKQRLCCLNSDFYYRKLMKSTNHNDGSFYTHFQVSI